MYRSFTLSTHAQLIDEIKQMAMDAGYIVIDDSVNVDITLDTSKDITAVLNPESPNSLLGYEWTITYGSKGSIGASPAFATQNKRRLVLYDGETYFHLFSYIRENFRDDATKTSTGNIGGWVEVWTSKGWTPGAIAGHTDLIKCTLWRRLPENKAYKAFFFTNNVDESPKYFHMALEIDPGIYTHASFGTLTKYFDWEGGDYSTTYSDAPKTAYSGSRNMDPPAFAEAGWYQIGGSDAIAPGNVIRAKFYEDVLGTIHPHKFILHNPGGITLVERSLTKLGRSVFSSTSTVDGGPLKGVMFPINSLPLPNPHSGTSPLFPIYVIVCNPADMLYTSIIGHYPNVFLTSIKNLDPQAEISLGQDKYMILPVRVKASSPPANSPYAYSGNWAYAYRK